MKEGGFVNQQALTYDQNALYLLIKIVFIGTFLSITYITRGLNASVVLAVVLISLWFLIEKVAKETVNLDFWEGVERKSQFQRLPLKKDIDSLEEARKGRKTKQAKIEDRLKNQVYQTLKIEYNLTGEEIRALKNGENESDIPNTKLLSFLKNARGMTELKRKYRDNQIFDDEDVEEHKTTTPDIVSKGDQEIDFDSKISRVMDELENIHHIQGGEEG